MDEDDDPKSNRLKTFCYPCAQTAIAISLLRKHLITRHEAVP